MNRKTSVVALVGVAATILAGATALVIGARTALEPPAPKIEFTGPVILGPYTSMRNGMCVADGGAHWPPRIRGQMRICVLDDRPMQQCTDPSPDKWTFTITMHVVDGAGPRKLTECYAYDTEQEAREMETFFAPKLNQGYHNAQNGMVTTPLSLSVTPPAAGSER